MAVKCLSCWYRARAGLTGHVRNEVCTQRALQTALGIEHKHADRHETCVYVTVDNCQDSDLGQYFSIGGARTNGGTPHCLGIIMFLRITFQIC